MINPQDIFESIDYGALKDSKIPVKARAITAISISLVFGLRVCMQNRCHPWSYLRCILCGNYPKVFCKPDQYVGVYPWLSGSL